MNFFRGLGYALVIAAALWLLIIGIVTLVAEL